jgi:hypothetical protein
MMRRGDLATVAVLVASLAGCVYVGGGCERCRLDLSMQRSVELQVDRPASAVDASGPAGVRKREGGP